MAMLFAASVANTVKRAPSETGSDSEHRVASTANHWHLGNARNRTRRSELEVHRSYALPSLPKELSWNRLRFRSELKADEPKIRDCDEHVKNLYPHFSELEPLHVEEDPNAPKTPVVSASPPTSPSARRGKRVGVVSLSNAVAASGTHNAMLGLRAFMDRKEMSGSSLVGIRSFKGNEFDIDSPQAYNIFINQAGSDMLRTIALARVNKTLLNQITRLCENLRLDALVFLCGPSEITHVGKINQHLAKEKPNVLVNCILHSVSGWVRMPGWIETNLGFDSACACLCEVAGNLALSRQALDRDIYHFVACGSKTLTIEVALQIRPTMCFIGEEIRRKRRLLEDIIEEICDTIVVRNCEYDLHAGVIMIADDFFEQMVEMTELRQEMHRLRIDRIADLSSEEAALTMLPERLVGFYSSLPKTHQHALVFRTGLDDLPLLLPLDVERIVGNLVAGRLAMRKQRGLRSVPHFEQHPHSLRHIALSPMPSILDCYLGYVLGHVAGALIEQEKSGYVANVRNVGEDVLDWMPCAVPWVRLLTWSKEDEEPKIFRRQLTEEDSAFRLWDAIREHCRWGHTYRQPGPFQYWGEPANKPPASRSYTLRVIFEGYDALVEELLTECEEANKPSPQVERFKVQSGYFRLYRRKLHSLSPLQRLRLNYQPQLPQVLQGPNRLAEEHRKGRVCADEEVLRRALPSLASGGHHKEVRLEPQPDQELNVLHLLPDKPARNLRKNDSWQTIANQSEGNLVGLAESPSDSDVGGTGKLKSPMPERTPSTSQLCRFELKRFHQRIGIVLIGRAGPGVNNVIQGLYDNLQVWDGKVICIAMGVAGLVHNYSFELTEELLAPHRNQGGCDLLGQSQPEDIPKLGHDLRSISHTISRLKLDGLVVWGGRNVHSWTARLSEYFVEHKIRTCVIAVPASVQSDLPLIEQTLGYDTACKLYSSIIGNLSIQAASAGMIWCFVRIPGRSISHIAAEVALMTHPHVVLMSADTGNEQLGLTDVTQMICNIIELRSRQNTNFGVILIPDQLLTSVFEMKQLFIEIREIKDACPDLFESPTTLTWKDLIPILNMLPPLTRALFQSLPERIRVQICQAVVEGGPARGGGTIDLGTVETENIFRILVEAELTRRVVAGSYKGPFQAISYSLPYQARAAMPSNFDCDLGYTIGYAAATFITEERTALMVDVTKLKDDVKNWEIFGTPISSLLTFNLQSEVPKPSLMTLTEKMGPADLQQSEEEALMAHMPNYYIQPRSRLLYDISYERSMPEPEERTVISPGPIQFWGPCCAAKTRTLCMPQVQRVKQMAICEETLARLKVKACAGCPPEVLKAVNMLLQGGADLLRQV